MFNKINEKDIQNLNRIISDPKRVYTKENIHEDYHHDELHTLIASPEVLIEAITTRPRWRSCLSARGDNALPSENE